MDAARHVHWQDGGMWVGYFEEFPDYPAQAETCLAGGIGGYLYFA